MDEITPPYRMPDVPHDEAERIAELYSLGLLDTESERAFDNFTTLVKDILGEGTCLLSLVDSDRQWFKAKSCEFVDQTSREASFCTHIVSHALSELIVPDTLDDPKFMHHPLVKSEKPLRAYAGVPVFGPQGFIIGSLCVVSFTPIQFSASFIHTLKCIAQKVTEEIAFRGKILKDKQQFIQDNLFDRSTNLPNKTFFFSKIKQQFLNSEYPATHSHLFLIEIERFHYMNSVYGDKHIDYLLQQIIMRVRLILPKDAILARCEKHQFALLCPVSNVTVEEIYALLKDAFEDAVTFEDKTIFTNINIAVSETITNYEYSEEDFDRLTQAIEHNKHIGQFSDPKFINKSDLAKKALEIENGLKLAIKQNAFTLVYQPIVESYTEAVLGVEALVRWRWKPNEFLSPAEFIPIAEEAGLILPLSRWILKTACIEFSGLQETIGFPLYLSVNISPSELSSEGFLDYIEECLYSSGMEPAQLQLEITEHALMTDFVTSQRILLRLQAMGIRIALDDFGTGHSSLQYLEQLPIDTIKIDRSFINTVESASESPP